MTLGEITTDGGRLCVLAVDHRDSLRAFVAPDHPDGIDDGRLVELKIELVRELAPLASGVMLEPELSIPQVPDAGVLPEGVGFIAALEAQGYLADPEAASTAILEGWSVAEAAALGAAAVKLLVPYHPDSRLARAQEETAAGVAAECRRVGIPLVLEPLPHGIGDPRRRPEVVLETVARFAALGPDVLKIPFPVDTAIDGDRTSWRRWCDRVDQRCPMPWALLSGGGSFASFRDQLAVALDAGCAGFMVGRALWGEAARARAEERAAVIRDVVLPRLAELVELTTRR